MNPALSVIVFTVFSGVGFGQLFWLGISPPKGSALELFLLFALAFSLTIVGLLSSTLHLGNPKRAWRAFSQWKTSWLSREGCLSIITLGVTSIYGLFIVFFDTQFLVLGIASACLSLLTVYTTSMIYVQLKTVPQWNHWMVCVVFLLLAITGGAFLYASSEIVVFMLIVSAIVQLWVWKKRKNAFKNSLSTMQTATGLGNIGQVRLLESPHSGFNYLCKEMVYVIGRKHAQKLQIIALLFMCIVPISMFLLLPKILIVILIALLFHVIGTGISRWLFFAQAEHVVSLYYKK